MMLHACVAVIKNLIINNIIVYYECLLQDHISHVCVVDISIVHVHLVNSWHCACQVLTGNIVLRTIHPMF